ncbi:uncharacterized protein [Aristolochia californica]|uniref:uncharacterized protein n=1 Tax=Aristolochia californica TaxID=171875 RepID=UPI0035DB3D44
MSRGWGNHRGRDVTADEVDALVEAAEELVLLNLKTDSHIARRRDSSSIDPDLTRRFDSLKVCPSAAPAKVPSPRVLKKDEAAVTSKQNEAPPMPVLKKDESSKEDEEMNRILGDDLAARFAALKGSSSSSASLNLGKFTDSMMQRKYGFDGDDSDDEDDDVDEEGISKKEVEKMMQWAADAARLDPSPSSDEEIDAAHELSDDDLDDENGLDPKSKQIRAVKNKKGSIRTGRTILKWFTFSRQTRESPPS